MGLKVNYYFGSIICRKSLLTHIQNITVMKESNFGSKSHRRHFEELNIVFKEVFAQLHEIESVMIYYFNPFTNMGDSSFIKTTKVIYEANIGKLELNF
jgi:hypothetical protein